MTQVNFIRPPEVDRPKRYKVYISGPMTGRPGFNYDRFHAVEQILSDLGFRVENPAKHFGGSTDLPRETYMRADFEALLKCDAVYFLEDWTNSAGARAEYTVAKELGLPLWGYTGREPVENEAGRIVRNGERQAIYGHPNQDFTRTASYWTTTLSGKLKDGEKVTTQDVALMMGQLKMSRLVSSPGHRDSQVDLIGYTICYNRLDEEG